MLTTQPDTGGSDQILLEDGACWAAWIMCAALGNTQLLCINEILEGRRSEINQLGSPNAQGNEDMRRCVGVSLAIKIKRICYPKAIAIPDELCRALLVTSATSAPLWSSTAPPLAPD